MSFFFFADIDDSKLIGGTEVINSTFIHNKTGCQMTFDDDYSAYWVYFVNFLGTLAVLPGNIVSALLMDKIGRLSMLGTNAFCQHAADCHFEHNNTADCHYKNRQFHVMDETEDEQKYDLFQYWGKLEWI